MASMFRPTVIRYVDKAGKRCAKGAAGAKRIRVKSKTWRGRYTDASGKTKSVTLFDDKDLSKAKFANIQQRVREERAGVRKHDPFEEHRETALRVSRELVGLVSNGEREIQQEVTSLLKSYPGGAVLVQKVWLEVERPMCRPRQATTRGKGPRQIS